MDLGKWQALAVGVLFLVLAGLIFVTSDPRAVVSVPEKVVRETLAPVQTAFSTVSHWAQETLRDVSSFGTLRSENRSLRQQVAVLQSEVRALQSLERENVRLRQLLDLQPRLAQQSIAAQVIARTPNQWFATVTINRGRIHGLEPGFAVVNAQGVVGHIESVTGRTAQVLLLVDPQSAVSGFVEGSDQPVLIEGSGDPAGNEAFVRPLVRGANLEPGDHIVTSGLSRIFPPGLPVGEIVEVWDDGYGLERRARLRPYVDFVHLDWVSVLLEPPIIEETGEDDQ